MHLHILDALGKIIHNPDKSHLWLLENRCPIGISDNIERSFCFPEATNNDDSAPSLLSIYNCNWRSAEKPDIVESLIEEKKIAEGWVAEFSENIPEA